MWKKFNNKIKKIIMKNKIYHAERDGWTYPVTKQLILDGRKNRVLNNKNSLKIPVTLFHSLNDMVISLSFSKKILKKFKKAKKRLIRIKGGDHSLSREGDLKIYSLWKSIFPIRKRIKKLMKKENYDIIYTQDWSFAFPLLFP